MDYFSNYTQKEISNQSSKRSSIRAYINPLHAGVISESFKDERVSKESSLHILSKRKESKTESRISSSSNADSIHSNLSIFGKLYFNIM